MIRDAVIKHASEPNLDAYLQSRKPVIKRDLAESMSARSLPRH
jgi:hypothetical protein